MVIDYSGASLYSLLSDPLQCEKIVLFGLIAQIDTPATIPF